MHSGFYDVIMNRHRIIPGETVISFEIPKDLADAKEIAHYLNCAEDLEEALLDALRLWVTHQRIVSRRLKEYIIEKTISDSEIEQTSYPNGARSTIHSSDPLKINEMRGQESKVEAKVNSKYPVGFQNFLNSIR